mmetsp:Transcript_24878/g.47694  ORF Transcript_24878/g.47694 Transcript_24878/m.47694 type:complete len:217 (-) Transcript_24878:1877-2527(-)
MKLILNTKNIYFTTFTIHHAKESTCKSMLQSIDISRKSEITGLLPPQYIIPHVDITWSFNFFTHISCAASSSHGLNAGVSSKLESLVSTTFLMTVHLSMLILLPPGGTQGRLGAACSVSSGDSADRARELRPFIRSLIDHPSVVNLLLPGGFWGRLGVACSVFSSDATDKAPVLCPTTSSFRKSLLLDSVDVGSGSSPSSYHSEFFSIDALRFFRT